MLQQTTKETTERFQRELRPGQRASRILTKLGWESLAGDGSESGLREATQTRRVMWQMLTTLSQIAGVQLREIATT